MFLLGSPEVNVSHNGVLIACLVFGASYGRRTIEMYERSAFARIAKEKSMRVEAEYQLSRLEDSRNERLHSDQHSHMAESEATFNLSITQASSADIEPAQAASIHDIGVQTQVVPTREQASETLIIWERDGFVCKQCAGRPPQLPSTSDGSQPRPVPKAATSTRRRARTRTRRSRSASGSCKPFILTGPETQCATLLMALELWHLPRDPSSCCPFHTAVGTAKRLVNILEMGRCDQLWSSNSAWQCPSCCSMNPKVLECMLCGHCEEEEGGSPLMQGQPLTCEGRSGMSLLR
eukprot:gnl/TRDRNA2_/TRDRNA2_126636_c0_seq1.p1 gnl/TRDRNA2_/TRDRNA2_126636_c0~~gnl/TRDRNA2_/TRDRNA2_126636_c0_seq1.p1  ORF type:complete len:292 (-),score=26.68 gnl/TRDRNA2_/TRDRNA2_126636_c0_seq1:21-896(-)